MLPADRDCPSIIFNQSTVQSSLTNQSFNHLQPINRSITPAFNWTRGSNVLLACGLSIGYPFTPPPLPTSLNGGRIAGDYWRGVTHSVEDFRDALLQSYIVSLPIPVRQRASIARTSSHLYIIAYRCICKNTFFSSSWMLLLWLKIFTFLVFYTFMRLHFGAITTLLSSLSHVGKIDNNRLTIRLVQVRCWMKWMN